MHNSFRFFRPNVAKQIFDFVSVSKWSTHFKFIKTILMAKNYYIGWKQIFQLCLLVFYVIADGQTVAGNNCDEWIYLTLMHLQYDWQHILCSAVMFQFLSTETLATTTASSSGQEGNLDSDFNSANTKLVTDLLKRHSKKLRPVRHPNDTLVVHLLAALYQIVDVVSFTCISKNMTYTLLFFNWQTEICRTKELIWLIFLHTSIS